jgi:tetratricopeptide (TPR) repeat protein
MSPMAREVQASERAKLSFGQLLAWHFLRGTRPGGRLDRPGRKWTPKEFADALGFVDRTVRFWLRDKHPPSDLETVERILFREDVIYAEWRLELRRAHAACVARNRRGNDVPLEVRKRTFFGGVPNRIVGFTGREPELLRIHQVLALDRAVAVVQSIGRAAVQGLGGVGKSSLAIEYANSFRGSYAGVWWCPAETRTDLLTALASLAVALDAAPARGSDIEKAANAALQRIGEQESPWLIVYDNVSSPEDIIDLLPTSPVRLLITSRFSDWQGWAEELPLDVLPMEDAKSFLQTRSGRIDESGAEALAETLGRLPLALDHAAAYCKRTQMSFADYAVKAEFLISTAPRWTVYPRSVAATFGLAIEEIIKQFPASEKLATFLAYGGPERMPLTLLDGAEDDPSVRDDGLAALAEVSLVRYEPFEDGSPAVLMHRLVQAVARARSVANGTARETVSRMISRLSNIFPDDGYDNPASWNTCAKLTPHVLVHMSGRDDQEITEQIWPDVLRCAGTYLHGRGAYFDAVRALREALRIGEKLLGSRHAEVASLVTDLAIALRDIDRLSPELGPLFRRAISIGEETLPRDHVAIGIRLSNLANFLRDTGSYSEAEENYERAIAIGIKNFGRQHVSVATRLHNLGGLLRKTGRLTEAEGRFREAMSIDEAVVGRNHHMFATDLNSLALLLMETGRPREAESLFQEALRIRQEKLGPDHPLTQCVWSSIAQILFLTKRSAEALPIAKASLAKLENAVGANHAWTKGAAEVAIPILHSLGFAREGEEVRTRYSIYEAAGS